MGHVAVWVCGCIRGGANCISDEAQGGVDVCHIVQHRRSLGSPGPYRCDRQ